MISYPEEEQVGTDIIFVSQFDVLGITMYVLCDGCLAILNSYGFLSFDA